MSPHSALDDGGGAGSHGKLADKTLSLSAPAAAHIREYFDRQGKPAPAIRVAAVRTRCMGGRGFGYSIQEDAAKPDDMAVESEGLSLLVDPLSMQYLGGTRIDYEESVQGSGLVVHNPNAMAKCHCGRHDIFSNEGTAGTEGC